MLVVWAQPGIHAYILSGTDKKKKISIHGKQQESKERWTDFWVALTGKNKGEREFQEAVGGNGP